jgi:hypothetical protein
VVDVTEMVCEIAEPADALLVNERLVLERIKSASPTVRVTGIATGAEANVELTVTVPW